MPQLHQVLYTPKTLLNGDLISKHVPIPVDRFGHCNFQPAEVLVAFGLLVQATGAPLSAANIAAVAPPDLQAQFKALAQEQGLK